MNCGAPFTLLPWGPANLGLSLTPVLFGISVVRMIPLPFLTQDWTI